MKYNLDNLYWQQFELISFKCLQHIVSPDVEFIEGGSDKGRDIIYTGDSTQFHKAWKGKWLFQCKHKNPRGKGAIAAGERLKTDLKKELKKVFIDNGHRYNNYVLINNLTLSGDLRDELVKIFDDFIVDNPGVCLNFDIISYRRLESCLDKNPYIIWQFPNILSHPDFEKMFNTPYQRLINTRTKGWFRGIAERRDYFVFTQQSEDAVQSLDENNIIILTGPPKSGKTFNAEMLTLFYSGNKNYQAIKIDDPDEVEKFYNQDKEQLFICDDAFGSHALSYTNADDWNRKLETIFNLANEKHKFIFSSRENIYQAFQNYAKDFDKQFLPKTTIESAKLTDAEKGAILDRYIQLSGFDNVFKDDLRSKEDQFITHKNFSPESVRAFFQNPKVFNKDKTVSEQLLDHLNQPDEYLKSVFYNLEKNSQAAVLSVLCAPENNFSNVQRTFANIRDDLAVVDLKPSEREFDELDGAIIKVTRTEQVEAVDFYHPSMQEFLITEIGAGAHDILRKIILKNPNAILFQQFVLDIPSVKAGKKSSKAVTVSSEDIKFIKTGLQRISDNGEIKLYYILPALQWLSGGETTNSKILARPLFNEVKELVEFIYMLVFEPKVFDRLKKESAIKWMNFLLSLRTLELIVGVKPPEPAKVAIIELIKEKRGDKDFWRMSLTGNLFLEEKEFEEAVGAEWLEEFSNRLTTDIRKLGYGLYGNHFPNADAYWKARRASGDATTSLETKRWWYPEFLIVQSKINLLKQAKGKDFNQSLLRKITHDWDVLMKVSTTAKNRHNYNVSQNWWEKN